MTFFSKAKFRFQPITDDKRIETVAFLQACKEIVPFFDILGPTAFAPVKSDINGNIQLNDIPAETYSTYTGSDRRRIDRSKLNKKHSEDPSKFETLQDIVQSEIDAGTTKAKNSATDALLWLKRALSFILMFLQEVLTREEDLTKCSKTAYENTLKRYHGWMVQSVFSLAMKAVPYRKDFIQKLGNGQEESVVLSEMEVFVDELRNTVNVITEFYQQTGQDDSKKI